VRQLLLLPLRGLVVLTKAMQSSVAWHRVAAALFVLACMGVAANFIGFGLNLHHTNLGAALALCLSSSTTMVILYIIRNKPA
jgi:hypothetical protein